MTDKDPKGKDGDNWKLHTQHFKQQSAVLVGFTAQQLHTIVNLSAPVALETKQTLQGLNLA